MMKRINKIDAIILAAIVLIPIALPVIFHLSLNRIFEKKNVTEVTEVTDIEKYKSPNDEYTLLFQQVGDPQWSFGAATVRLVLKDNNERTINKIDAQIQDDGMSAGSRNVKSIVWNKDSVLVTLCASEMSDKEIVLSFES